MFELNLYNYSRVFFYYMYNILYINYNFLYGKYIIYNICAPSLLQINS